MNKLDKQYQDLLIDIIHNGVSKTDRTGTGTKSVFGRQIRHKMSEGFPLLTTKKMAWKSIVTELLWFLKGQTNIKYLVDNGCSIWNGDAYKNYWEHNKIQSNPKWLKPVTYSNGNTGAELYNMEEFINKIKTDNEFAEKWGNLGPIYGAQWRRWRDGVDQIANLINELKTNPDSRRLMVSAWNVGELDQMVLPPCHYGFQIYTRELSHEERINLCLQLRPDSKFAAHYETNETLMDDWGIPKRAISLMWNQRSVDTFLGLPFNIASYGLLLHIIANEVNMVPDELIGNLGDVHLYNNHREQAVEQLDRTPYELPKINFNTEWWDKPFIEAIKSDSFCNCLLEEDIQLYDYKYHPAIKAPLSN